MKKKISIFLLYVMAGTYFAVAEESSPSVDEPDYAKIINEFQQKEDSYWNKTFPKAERILQKAEDIKKADGKFSYRKLEQTEIIELSLILEQIMAEKLIAARDINTQKPILINNKYYNPELAKKMTARLDALNSATFLYVIGKHIDRRQVKIRRLFFKKAADMGLEKARQSLDELPPDDYYF